MHPPGHFRPDDGFTFTLIAVVFTCAFVVMTVIAMHLRTLLQARGLELGVAVALGTLIGPAQVGGRLVEMAFGKCVRSSWTLLVSSASVARGTVLLLLAGATILYGVGSGLRSIVRGTLPLVLFRRVGYAILMGRLSVPCC